MNLSKLIIPTEVAVAGMTVREVFRICVEADVPGVPFQNEQGQVVGRASIRHILKETCIPDFMVRHSKLLGDDLEHLTISRARIDKVLQLPVDEFILPETAVATPNTPFSKALAIMEDNDTTYLFVCDEGVYRGVVSITGIARVLISDD